MGVAGVGPIEVAEQGVVTEDHVLPTGLHAQALDAGKVPDQHVGSPDAQATVVATAVATTPPLWFNGSPPLPALAAFPLPPHVAESMISM